MLSHVQGAMEEAKDTFLWWSKRERQFMIVDYLARAI